MVEWNMSKDTADWVKEANDAFARRGSGDTLVGDWKKRKRKVNVTKARGPKTPSPGDDVTLASSGTRRKRRALASASGPG